MPPVVKRKIGFAGGHEIDVGTKAVDDAGRIHGLSRAEVFKTLNQVITERDGEWCGLPVPLPGLGLVLEDKHPRAEQIAELQRITDEDEVPVERERGDFGDGWGVMNKWRATLKGGVTADVYVVRHVDGRIAAGIDPLLPRRNRLLLGPLETLDAWNVETEVTAMERLATLLSERMFKAYLLTGTFLETSKRSGLVYIFRRLRPTVVMSPHRTKRQFLDDSPPEGDMHILTCLCLHPLGYYANSFCGAMTPTDDVIAHLLMMRADEHLFWKRANHHAPAAPESGL